MWRACGVLIPSPCVNNSRTLIFKIHRPSYFWFFRRFPRINVGGDSTSFPSMKDAPLARTRGLFAPPPEGGLWHFSLGFDQTWLWKWCQCFEDHNNKGQVSNASYLPIAFNSFVITIHILLCSIIPMFNNLFLLCIENIMWKVVGSLMAKEIDRKQYICWFVGYLC